MDAATLRLFNSIQVAKKHDQDIPISVHERTVRNGYILDRSVRPDNRLLDAIEHIVGVSGEKANAAFHKSWTIIQESSMEALVAQQIVHYFTTYGFKRNTRA